MLFLATLALSAAPQWLDRSLAGYAMSLDGNREMIGVRDAKRGFFLLRTTECDGAILTLTLTRDRNVVASAGYAVPNFKPKSGDNGSLPLVDRPLPSLATGKGIVIGDAPGAVRRRLGTPTTTKSYPPFGDFVYKGHAPDAPKVDLVQRYTFKAGRLIEVQFSRDSTEE